MKVKPLCIGCEVVIEPQTYELLQVALYIQLKDEQNRRIGWTHAYSPTMLLELGRNEDYKNRQPGFIWQFFLKALVELEKKEKNYVSDDNIGEISEVMVPEISKVVEHVVKRENYVKRFEKMATISDMAFDYAMQRGHGKKAHENFVAGAKAVIKEI